MMKSTPLEWPLITTSDTVDFTDAAGNVITGVGLWVSVAGAIKVKWGSGRVETLDATTVPAGEQFWGLIKRVYTTGTTATGIRVAFNSKVS